MATNVVQVNAYNINLGTGGAVGKTLAFPTGSTLLGDCSSSPQRVLSNGLSVYSTLEFNGVQYYSQQTLAALVTAFNA